MGAFVKGDVVVVPFPFTDLTGAKKRPAFIAADLTGNDVIICLITSQAAKDDYAIAITNADFASGSLYKNSSVLPNRVFTADSKIILYKAGVLKPAKVDEITKKLPEIISS